MGKMNEAMRAELQHMSGDYERAQKEDSELNFKAGVQKVYFEEVHFDRAKKGANAGMPIVILTLRGAEKTNKKATHDVIFILTTSPDKSGNFHREKLKNFMWGFGVKSFDLGRLDEVFDQIVNKVFEAKIDFDKNGFISVSPQKVIGDLEKEVEDGSKECPF